MLSTRVLSHREEATGAKDKRKIKLRGGHGRGTRCLPMVRDEFLMAAMFMEPDCPAKLNI